MMDAIDVAVASGARQAEACGVMGIDRRTLQRWRARESGEDLRAGPKTEPRNKLSPSERRTVIEIVNSPKYRDLSPNQIVPLLADQGIYVASESTIYRVLHQEGQVKHRETSRAPQKRHRPVELEATGPNQVWSWDITYLRSPIRGEFFRLYMVMDVWSRKTVGWEVHDHEDADLAALLIEHACAREGIRRNQLTIHSDNGAPMKGATLLATLQNLGVATSFSRPRVSNDNPFSEALFRTVKYRPEFPSGAFESIETARSWVESFVHWYNTEHLHSAIRYVTPEQRHNGESEEILRRRDAIYEAARERHPDRWSGQTRNWEPIRIVYLNPEPDVPAKNSAA